jgi:hypothetical protein
VIVQQSLRHVPSSVPLIDSMDLSPIASQLTPNVLSYLWRQHSDTMNEGVEVRRTAHMLFDRYVLTEIPISQCSDFFGPSAVKIEQSLGRGSLHDGDRGEPVPR